MELAIAFASSPTLSSLSDSIVDAICKGNKSKFFNHHIAEQNCSAKVVRAGGEHHITIWAARDIKRGEELLFNYGYHGAAAPEWSQDPSSESTPTTDNATAIATPAKNVESGQDRVWSHVEFTSHVAV